MTPRARRRAAIVVLVLSVTIGWPLSWWLPGAGLDETWYQRVLLFISFLAITITCADITATTDVRTEQESGGERAGGGG